MKLLIFSLVLALFELSFANGNGISSNCESQASPVCPGKLGPLCRSQHSMRRLKDGRILVAGGYYGTNPTCEIHTLDLTKKEVSLTSKIDIAEAIGFRVDDNWYAFSDRTQDKNSVEPPDFQGWDRIVFTNLQGKPAPMTVFVRRLTGASTPVLMRNGNTVSLVLYYGHERLSECSTDDGENGLCLQRYQVDVYQLKFDDIAKFAKKYAEGDGTLYADFSWQKKSMMLKTDSQSDRYTGGQFFDDVAFDLIGTLKRARVQFDTTTFSDGRMFIAGGREQANDSKLQEAETAEYFIPGKGWFETSPLPFKGRPNVKTFGFTANEVLAVEMDKGEAWTWSFETKKWKSAFKIGKAIARGMMHSSGNFIALAQMEKGNEQLHIFNPKTGKIDQIASPLTYFPGVSVIELADQKLLETHPKGALIWDLKAKTATPLKL